jgi:hypothetical protein
MPPQARTRHGSQGFALSPLASLEFSSENKN